MATDIQKYTNGKLKILGHIGALLTMGAWGSSFVFTKVLMVDGGLTPAETYTYRFAAAYILLLLMSFKKLCSNNWRDELTFLVCGVCSGSLYYILENYALTMTTTGNVSLLASISPLFTTVLMAIVFKQRIKIGVIMGSIMAFFGVACVIFNKGFDIQVNPAGDLLAISASMAWAIYSILVKRVMPHYNGLFITRKLFFYGVLTSLPLLYMQHEPYHLPLLFDFAHPKYLLNFLFLVVMCSILGFVVWNEVMRILGPVMANNYIYLQPLVTLIVAYFVFDEQIHYLGYAGCFLIIGGLIVADKFDSRRKRGRPTHLDHNH